MRKIYLFVLLALSFVGAGMAWAALIPDRYPEESRLTELKEGDKFFIRSEFSAGNGGNYWNETGTLCHWLSLRAPYEAGKEKLLNVQKEPYDVTDEGIFTIESAGKKITGANGVEFDAYYLKNVSCGLYIAEGTYRNDKSSFLKFTDNKEEAVAWGFRPVSDLVADNAYTEGKWYIFTVNAGNNIVYLNAGVLTDPEQNVQAPFYGEWTDAPGWFDLVPPTEETIEVVDQVMLLIDKISPYGSIGSKTVDEVTSTYYFMYGGPGGYGDDIVAEFNSVMNFDPNSDEFWEMSDEEFLALRDRMNTLLLHLYDAEMQMLEEGFYQIVSTYTPWATDFRAVYADGKILRWNVLEGNETNPTYIFHITPTEDGKYRIQSLSEGTFFTVCANNGVAQLTVDEEFGAQFISLGNSEFNLRIGTDSGNDVHPKGHSDGAGTQGDITGYAGGKDSQSSWRLVPVSEEVYTPYLEEMERKLEEARKQDAIDKEVAAVQAELLAKIAEVNAATKSAFEYELPEDAIDVTPTSVFDIESNGAMLNNAPAEERHGYSWGGDGGGYGALIDNNLDTYFHTTYDKNRPVEWSSYNEDGTPTEWATRTTLHNLAVKLAQPASNIAFQVSPRKGSYNNPTKIDIDASHDGKTWVPIFYGYNFFTPSTNAEVPYIMGPFELGEEYEYVRFCNYGNDRTNDGRRFFTFSELKVFVGARLKPTCQAATMDQAIVSNFLKAYSDANKYADLVAYEQIDEIKAAVNNLQAAYEAFVGIFADPTALKNAIADAENIIANFKVGDNMVGLYDGSETTEALSEAVAKANNLMESGSFTQNALDEAQNEIAEAYARLQATCIMPDPNKWYQFVFPSEAEYDANPSWARSEAEYNGTGEAALYDRVAAVLNGNSTTTYEDITTLRPGQGMMWSTPESLIAENPEVSYFRLIPVEGGKYIIQNKATGLYIPSLVQSVMPALGTTPGYFDIDFMGGGCVILYGSDMWTGEYNNGSKSAAPTLHFAWNNYKVTAWPDHTIGTKSSIHIREVAGVEGPALSYGDAVADGAYAITSFNDIQNIEGAIPYTVTGIFQDIYNSDDEEPILYAGLNVIGEYPIPAGTPFILIASEPPYVLTLGTDFTTEVQTTPGLCGLFQSKPAEAGMGVLKNETVDEEVVNFFQMFDGTTTSDIAPYTAYITPEGLPETVYDEFDMLILIRGELNPTGIAKLPSNIDLSGDVYNLAGQRVGKASDLRSLKSGIYVVNGKKVLIP